MSASRFWRPGDSSGPSLGINERQGTTENQSVDKNGELSVHSKRVELLYLLEKHLTVIVKRDLDIHGTKMLAQILMDGNWSAPDRAIAVAQGSSNAVRSDVRDILLHNCLQPEDIGGDVVGYALGYDTRRSLNTKIIYFTFETLLLALRDDPLLSGYSLVLVDAGHEQSLLGDILLSILRVVQRRRGNLRILISTTDLNTDHLLEFFGTNTTAILSVQRQRHRVKIWNVVNPAENYLQRAIETVKACHANWLSQGSEPRSDILVFVARTDEADVICNAIAEWAASPEMAGLCAKQSRGHGLKYTSIREQRNRGQRKNMAEISSLPGSIYAVPLHASMTPEERQLSLELPPDGKQRVIAATNFAETSEPPKGVSIVVDTGYQRLLIFSPRTQMQVLATIPISQASAWQRAMCAGGEKSGECFRLYTREDFWERLPKSNAPEILRSDLSKALLMLISIGVESLATFDFLIPPTRDMLVAALERLYAFGALGIDGSLTALGKRLCDIPLPPAIGRLLLAGEERGVGRQVASVCAMIQAGQSCFTGRKQSREAFAVAEGDVITLLNVYRRYISSKQSLSWCQQQNINPVVMQRVHRLCKALLKHLKGGHINPDALAADAGLSIAARISRAIAVACYSSLAVVQSDGRTYRTLLSNVIAAIHPDSTLRGRSPHWIVAFEMVHGRSIYMRNVTVVQPAWLCMDLPSIFQTKLPQESS